MDTREKIINLAKKERVLKTSQLVKRLGLSRAYIQKILKELRERGVLVLVGQTNRAHYLLTEDFKKKKKPLSFRSFFENENLREDYVIKIIKKETDIFKRLKRNVSDILEYAFLEMLNNAIEHSRSKKVLIEFSRDNAFARFKVVDWGVGIFEDIRRKFRLKSVFEAINLVIKGKHTTKPEAHSGEGIFFTSKVGDKFVLESSKEKLIFDNVLDDVFLKKTKKAKGTTVFFEMSLKSKKELNDIFAAYTGRDFVFNKTKIVIKLSKKPEEGFISRSQARRVIFGLEKFKEIILDFKGVKTIGQSFADEIFRVWSQNHQDVKINYVNASKEVEFMIKRALRPDPLLNPPPP